LLGATLTLDANANCRRPPLASYSDCLKILGSPFFLWEATSANSVLMQASQSRLKDTQGLTRIWKRITGAIESSVMG